MEFKKVSYEQYCKDINEEDNKIIRKQYKDIKLPERGTKYSAGYDFFSPIDFTLNPGEVIKIPTGIQWNCKHELTLMAQMSPTFVLNLYPRSGLGFKYQLCLCNTVGIIDEDYCMSDNEGHIIVKLVNRGNETISIEAGQGIVQGIINMFWITDNDNAQGIRNGGFGSTDKK